MSIAKNLAWPLSAVAALSLLSSTAAFAQDATAAKSDTNQSKSEESARDEDATGGAYTSPTLLFMPAAAVPKWNARVIVSTELQGPADVHATFRPGLGGELGLPGGVTIGAGTNWVGGDVNQGTGRTDFNLGLSPYAQARIHILGRDDGYGFQLGTGLVYKFVGFEGDPGELELAVSTQYRHTKYEIGLQAVLGQDLREGDGHDGELHAYAVYRVIPQLAVGGAGQVRIALGDDNEAVARRSYDVIGGAIASLTLGRYGIGALGGASTLGLDRTRTGALAQLFGTVRF